MESKGEDLQTQEQVVPSVEELPDNPFAIFINDLVEMFPNIAPELIKAAIEVIQEKFQGRVTDMSVYFNELGHEVKAFSLQASAELYGRAYDTERPYRPETNKPLYGRNFITTLYQALEADPSLVESQADWVADRRTTLIDAAECVSHFRNLEIYKDGWNELAEISESTRELTNKNNRSLSYAKHLLENHLRDIN
jgi:hypothetical protein